MLPGMPQRHAAAVCLGLAMAAALPGCGEPPSWQKLLAAKITEQYPHYTVLPGTDGGLLVRRPGRPDAPVDVEAIAVFCRRGPKDCNYATDQLLLELR
jgi:hypothetical protein